MTLTPEQEFRRQKLLRAAPMIATNAHLQKIMATFPEEHREALLAEIKSTLDLKDKQKD